MVIIGPVLFFWFCVRSHGGERREQRKERLFREEQNKEIADDTSLRFPAHEGNLQTHAALATEAAARLDALGNVTVDHLAVVIFVAAAHGVWLF